MQVTKGIWRMREQCVPGSLLPPPHKSLGTRLGLGVTEINIKKVQKQDLKALKM